MSDNKSFACWIDLRQKYRLAKKNKDYLKIISYSNQIIELSQKDSSIGIMVPLFEYDIAESYSKLGDNENALKYYIFSKNHFISYRATHQLSKPEDFLSYITKIDKKIGKLQK